MNLWKNIKAEENQTKHLRLELNGERRNLRILFHAISPYLWGIDYDVRMKRFYAAIKLFQQHIPHKFWGLDVD